MTRSRRHPIGGQMSDVTGGLFRRFGLTSLEQRHDSVLVLGAFALVNGCISIAIMAFAALVTGQPFMFPSLGPTAFLLFYTPLAVAASPRNTVAGHLIGVIFGYSALVIFGLLEAGSAMSEGFSLTRVFAAAFAVGFTSAFMIWLRVPHPPAGATTLIVSLGILVRPEQLAVLMLAVVLLTGQGIIINRLAGLDYPLWAPTRKPDLP